MDNSSEKGGNKKNGYYYKFIMTSICNAIYHSQTLKNARVLLFIPVLNFENKFFKAQVITYSAQYFLN